VTTRSAICQQREAHHREIAAHAQLPNVRNIALAAARAWHEQAVEAARQEQGVRPTLSKEDATIALEFLLEENNGIDSAIKVEDISIDLPPFASRLEIKGNFNVA
jgi:hypothetical protein